MQRGNGGPSLHRPPLVHLLDWQRPIRALATLGSVQIMPLCTSWTLQCCNLIIAVKHKWTLFLLVGGKPSPLSYSFIGQLTICNFKLHKTVKHAEVQRVDIRTYIHKRNIKDRLSFIVIPSIHVCDMLDPWSLEVLVTVPCRPCLNPSLLVY